MEFKCYIHRVSNILKTLYSFGELLDNYWISRNLIKAIFKSIIIFYYQPFYQALYHGMSNFHFITTQVI